MSAGAAGVDRVELARADYPAIEKGMPATNDAPHTYKGEGHMSDSENSDVLVGPNGEQYPTEEELKTLRRVQGHVPWLLYSIAFVELCERFGYYGTTVVFQNYVNWSLPDGSRTGAGGADGQSGALGYGSQAATGINLFNTFWSYLTPMIGGWVADTYWGRFKCIQVAIGIATVGHIVIVISALPPVLENTSAAMGVFCLGLVIFGVGVGFFKCNISPLIAEQYQKDNPRATVFVTKTGERVIHDPQMTLSRIYIRYYFFINVGALVGQITMVYAEKYVGFWLAFLLPTIMFLFCPVVMILCRNRYVRIPPTGSVLTKAARLIAFAMKRSKTANIFRLRDQDLWDSVKPSHLSAEERPAWMTFDDAWVDQVRRGLSACAVFIFLPIYWLSYNQMTSNLVTQAGTMALHGLPNDIVNNIDPIALLILIPIFDKLIYPSLARASIRFTPIKKIAAGLGLGCLSMVTAAVIQHYIYMKAPCGDNATDGDCIAELGPPNLNVWIQTPAYVLIAVAEIFASVTTLEYAYTKAPSNMRSFVTGLYWFTNAFSAALGQAFVPLSVDPLFTWNYTVIACISFVAMVLFWVFFRKLDQEEDMLNALPDTTFKGRKNSVVDLEAVQQEQARQEKLRRAQGLDHAKGAQ